MIELASDASLTRDLASGGVFVPGCALRMADECELVVCGANRRVSVPARVVYIDEHRGAGLELIGFSTELREQLAELEPIGRWPALGGSGASGDPAQPSDEDDLAVPVANDLDEDDRTIPVSTGVQGAPDDAAPDDDLAVPVSTDADDDHLTIPISTGVHPADDVEHALPMPSEVDRAEDDRALPVASDAELRHPLTRRAASCLPMESVPAIAIAEADAALFDAAYAASAPAADPDLAAHKSDDAGDRRGELRSPRNVHERLRGLSLVAQIKLATSGELHERIGLERLYGKNVWETLLRNPRLTPPEVSRIARYGTLPRVLLEIILANNAWLAVPEVRRALLSNPRLPTDQIMKVLRLVPKHELRLAAIQTAYPHPVRNAAKLLLAGE
jgi:hypothetical protein